MKIYIANPIYDVVFKFLMEDERIAKTILSALLKKDVVAVEMRRHEYSNGVRDKISMFRIDFGATIRETDGSEHLILIELQKTWLETETLRFRQYLGAHYANPENIQKDEYGERSGYAIPMVTVYLLGHKVGDIEEPILYVNHVPRDYNGKEVTKGIPDPFVNSLTHNTIIVQIPRLHGRVNNRLEQLLQIFDQTLCEEGNQQKIVFENDPYEGDKDMEHILQRLAMAASDSKMRYEMIVEDEYFSALENRDTAIMRRDKKLAEQGEKLAEQGEKLAEQGEKLVKQAEQLAEKDAQLTEQMAKLEEKEALLEAKDLQIASIAKSLHDSGMPTEQVSLILGITEAEAERLIDLIRDKK